MIRETHKEKIRKENRLVQYLRETRAELSKVVWPSRAEVINLTAIVVGTIVVMSIFFGAVDYWIMQLFRLFLRQLF